MGYEEQVNYETNNIQIIIMIIKLSWKQIIIIIRMVKKRRDVVNYLKYHHHY